MKLSKSVDARMIFRDIYYFLIWFLLVDFLLRLILSRGNFSLRSIFIFITVGAINIIRHYSRVVFFEKPYIYLEHKGEKVSPLNDTPIKLTDITGYSLNNPFPSFSRRVSSSHNLTLYFPNGKYKTVSVKEQSILVDWFKENNISCISKKSRGSIIEHIIYTAANVFFIVLYFYQIKAKDTDLDIILLMISAVCFVCWIVYILSGLYIRKKF